MNLQDEELSRSSGTALKGDEVLIKMTYGGEPVFDDIRSPMKQLGPPLETNRGGHAWFQPHPTMVQGGQNSRQ